MNNRPIRANRPIDNKSQGTNQKRQAGPPRQQKQPLPQQPSKQPLAKKPKVAGRGEGVGAGSRSAIGKTSQLISPALSQKKHKPTVSSRRSPNPLSVALKKWLADSLAFSLLFGGSALFSVSAWFSYQLILNPDVGIWLNQFLPASTQIPLQPNDYLYSLEEIREELKAVGRFFGEPLPLPNREVLGDMSNSVTTARLEERLFAQNPYLKPWRSFLLPHESLVQAPVDLLIPVMQTRESSTTTPCPTGCKEIVELRVYKSVQTPYQAVGTPQLYRLVYQLPVNGPAESFVLASLIGTRANQQGGNRPLPLTDITTFKNKVPESGVWFNLYGNRLVGDTQVPYGHIIHYNPKHYHLSSMLEWKSAAGQHPIWENVTGGPYPELLVEQTMGLEPQFSIYQVRPRRFVPNPIELVSISLDQEVVDHYAYRRAIRLARSGLWSPALSLMEPLKKNSGTGGDYPQNWPALAEAQLQLIQFHASITDAQATAAWASPSQKVLAGLIDGRWSEALNVVQSSSLNQTELLNLLQADGGRIKNRIQAALLENPEEPDLQAWGALILVAQQGRSEAIAWLETQSQASPDNKTRIRQLLD
ncbi:MAG: hypothetical protein EA414_20150 [Arthrospira sp. PLM2.Bin9]|nr:hypothetical protein [Arthrospira sp. PLM2.Bin9]TVU51937.1 MAG: hypothetical protein EA414_20150 [Arthrospira sp. PLM2.Bin9]